MTKIPNKNEIFVGSLLGTSFVSIFVIFLFYNPETNLDKYMKLRTNHDLTKTLFLFQVFSRKIETKTLVSLFCHYLYL